MSKLRPDETSRSEGLSRLWTGIHRALQKSEESGMAIEQSEPFRAESLNAYQRRLHSLAPLFRGAGVLTTGFVFQDPNSGDAIFFEEGSALADLASNLQTPYIFSDKVNDQFAAGVIVHHAFLATRRQQLDQVDRTIEPFELNDWSQKLKNSSGLSAEFFRKYGALVIDDRQIACGIAAWLIATAQGATSLCLGELGPEHGDHLRLDTERLSLYAGPERNGSTGSERISSLARLSLDSWQGAARFVALLQENETAPEFHDNAAAFSYLLSMMHECVDPRTPLRDIAAPGYLEDVVGAPIIAYLIWGLLDPQPRYHVAAPVWSTVDATQARRTQSTHNRTTVGWALATIAPLGKNGDGDPDRHIDIVLLLSLFNLLARPAIDLVYYNRERLNINLARMSQFVSSIMSRNVSHNIGSHVLHNIVFDRQSHLDGDTKSILTYIQERMDFIGLVAVHRPYWSMVEPLPRVLEPFLRDDFIVLKHIIRSQRTTAPKIQLTPEAAQITLAVPHGVVGRHALFAILENLIRNAAKYSDSGAAEQLVYQVRAPVVHVSDNPRTHACIEIVDNSASSAEIAATLNGLIGRPIYDPGNELAASRHWGLKEIKISAAFLNGRFDDLFEQRSGTAFEPQYFLAEPDEDGRQGLGLRLWLKQPAGVLVISSNAIDLATGLLSRDPLVEIIEPQQARRAKPQDYDLVILDGDDVYDLAMENDLFRNSNGAHRIAITGSKLPVDYKKLGAVNIGSWAAIQTGLTEKPEPGEVVASLCSLWSERKWPNAKIVLVDDGRGRFPQLELAADQHLKQPLRLREDGAFIDADGTVLHSDIRTTAFLDHTNYQESVGLEDARTTWTALAKSPFHAPIKAPASFAYKEDDLRWRLREVTSLRIAVIDERIWRDTDYVQEGLYMKAPDRGLEARLAWQRLGVDLIDPTTVPVRGQTVRRAQIRGYAARVSSIEKYDYVVVHRGWFDKWFYNTAVNHAQRNAAERTRAIDLGHGIDVLIDQFLEWGTILVLVSGRGPEQRQFGRKASRRIRQMEFSILREAILGDSDPDKIRIASILTGL